MTEFEDLDPLFSLLDQQEHFIVTNIFQLLVRFFPGESLGHKVKEVASNHFVLYIAGFKTLDLVFIRRLISSHRPSFRHFEVLPDTETSTIGFDISFYRTSERGKNKPLGFQNKTKDIHCEDLTKGLASSELSAKDSEIAKSLLEQFCFVERYSSGNIYATLQDDCDHYLLIFSNVKSVHSGFLASYLNFFRESQISFRFSSQPFEVVLKVEKKDFTPAKKRSRESEDVSVKRRRK